MQFKAGLTVVKDGDSSAKVSPESASAAGLETLVRLARNAALQPEVSLFYFLRHGETAGNAAKTFQPIDEPLNARGHEQARAAAEVLRGVEFSHIVASDQPRAWLTAGKVAAVSGRAATAEVRLRERFFGDLIGTPNLGINWEADPPGGETLIQFVSRAIDGLRSATRNGGLPLIVSHGGVLHVVRSALGLPLTGELIANAMPLRFARTGSRWTVDPLR